MRKVEVKINDEWIFVGGLDSLYKGDIFRMFEKDGEPVVGEDNQTEWKAISEPYWSDTFDSWMIDIDIETNVIH